MIVDELEHGAGLIMTLSGGIQYDEHAVYKGDYCHTKIQVFIVYYLPYMVL
jgi:hypothetical protein